MLIAALHRTSRVWIEYMTGSFRCTGYHIHAATHAAAKTASAAATTVLRRRLRRRTATSPDPTSTTAADTSAARDPVTHNPAAIVITDRTCANRFRATSASAKKSTIAKYDPAALRSVN